MRCILLAIALLISGAAFGRAPPGSDPNSQRGMWFANQVNMMGGGCCQLGDGHELDPGDVRYDQNSGLYSVRLPDPSEETFGHSLNEHYTKPKQWVEIVANKIRDPKGGMPPMSSPIIWFDTGTAYGATQPYYRIYCFEPNPQS